MKLFKVKFSYAPSSMASGIFAEKSKEKLISEIIRLYSDHDPDYPLYGLYVYVDREPRTMKGLGYETGMVEFSVEELTIDKPGVIHMAYSCC